MSHDEDNIVKVASGSIVEVELWQQTLTQAGITCKVVGNELSSGLGTALPDAVELWVHESRAAKAQELIAKTMKP